MGYDDLDSFHAHTLCRTGATFLVDAGSSVMELKNYGGWQCDSVAESYVSQSIFSKKQIAIKLQKRMLDDVNEDGGDEKNKRRRLFSECSFYDCNVDVKYYE